MTKMYFTLMSIFYLFSLLYLMAVSLWNYAYCCRVHSDCIQVLFHVILLLELTTDWMYQSIYTEMLSWSDRGDARWGGSHAIVSHVTIQIIIITPALSYHGRQHHAARICTLRSTIQYSNLILVLKMVIYIKKGYFNHSNRLQNYWFRFIITSEVMLGPVLSLRPWLCYLL